MKGAQPSVVTTRPDAASQRYIDQLRARATGYAGMNTYNGPDPAVLEALSGFRGYANAGRQGAAAVGGDASAASRFLNPYFATLDPLFNKLRTQAGVASDQDATRAGVFAGSRAGAARGAAQGAISAQQAQLGYQNYNDAMARAAQAANLGFGADQALLGGGQYLQFLPQLFQQMQLGLLNTGLGPTGSTQETQTSYSPFQQLLGAGLTIAPWFFPGGGLATTAAQAATSRGG